MSQIKATFTGSVVAEPQAGTTPNGASNLQFPVYVNHAKKDKTSGTYSKTGDVSKIRVTLWGDKTSTDIRQGDLVEVTATIVEKEFKKRDGSDGRSIQTDWVESITVKHRNQGPMGPQSSLAVGLEVPADDDAPF
jgi:single-stranded DNA-binding protein